MGCSGSVARDSASPPRHFGALAFHRKYVLGVTIGRGGFGQVRAAALRTSERAVVRTQPKRAHASTAEATTAKATATNAVQILEPTHAVKVLELGGRKDGCEQKALLLDALAEDQAWRAAGSHANVLELLDSYVDTDVYKTAYFVSELCLGSLLDARHGHLLGNAEAFVDVARGMCSGLAHLHGRSIVHRDVKPENFLMGADARTVKLCDFGMAAVVPRKGLRGVSGTAPYMAPEMLLRKRYGVAVDAWSYGVTCYRLLLGDFPFVPTAGLDGSERQAKQAIKQAILDGRPPSYTPKDKTWPALRPCAKRFIRALLIRDVQMRPALEDLSQHAFLKERAAPPIEGAVQEIDHCQADATAQKSRVPSTVHKSSDDLPRHLSESEPVTSRAPRAMPRSFGGLTCESVASKALLPDDNTSTACCQSGTPTLDSLPPSDGALSRGKATGTASPVDDASERASDGGVPARSSQVGAAAQMVATCCKESL